ncbi:MAG: helix-turn-helix transcriptional regulator [Gammaproteobacteria bacterium]|nr:helix-turn-helix transcriptional regulator [Gammaproteobacteria bacterium]
MKSTSYKDLNDPVGMAEDLDKALKLLGKRISSVADLYPSRKSAAAVAGVSTDQLSRYMRGENQPGLLTMAALAKTHGFSLDWLASGVGDPKGANMDLDLLTMILDTIEQAATENDIKLSGGQRSRLAALLYSLHESGNKESLNPANVVRLIDFGQGK